MKCPVCNHENNFMNVSLIDCMAYLDENGDLEDYSREDIFWNSKRYHCFCGEDLILEDGKLKVASRNDYINDVFDLLRGCCFLDLKLLEELKKKLMLEKLK